jgi:cytochrome c biogenesis protein CcmG, thiol:disulfide interchange protein DsbE
MVARRACIALLAAGALAGCGANHPRSAAPTSKQASAALAGSSAPLADLHDEANQLIGGGTAAFKARLSKLHGYPVVVNKWASWCGPCQSEFPVFQKVAVAYGRQVAFLGVNSNDHDQAAKAFLRSYPVTYPSYTDPQQSIAAAIKAATYFPQTVFFDRAGKAVFEHAGPYESASALEQDIRHYVLTRS